jgi:cytochrome c556
MTRLMIVGTVLALAIGGTIVFSADEEEVTIKDVMKKAHGGKPSLKEKVQTGKASDDEKKTLLELYTALGKNKPPKGEEEAFKKKTDALIAAAKAATEGKKNASQLLAKASNCGACHKDHKP